MRRSLETFTFFLLLACVAALPARAQEAQERVEFHGFGTWSYGRTNANTYLQGLPGGSYEHAEMALNVIATVRSNFKVIAQAAIVETENGSSERLDYGFAEWRFSDRVKLRIGQVKQPFGISTEIFTVGTLRPFLFLPQGVYGPVGLVGISYKGIGVTGARDLSRGWRLSYDLYAGGIDLEELVHPEQFLLGEPVSGGKEIELEKTKDVLGGRAVLETPVEGLRFGFSAYGGNEIGSDRRTVYGWLIEYLSERWSLRHEYAHERVADDLRVRGSYVEAACRLGGHWQVAVQYDKLTTELAHISAPVAPSLLDHEEGAIGLNYWFSPALVVKASFHRVDGNRFASPEPDDLSPVVASGDLRTRTTLFLFGGQFSF